jgi:hypothetical protein
MLQDKRCTSPTIQKKLYNQSHTMTLPINKQQLKEKSDFSAEKKNKNAGKNG